MPNRIPIKAVEELAKKYDLRQVILLGYDGERTHVVTYGKTKKDCEEAAIAQKWWDGKVFPPEDKHG